MKIRIDVTAFDIANGSPSTPSSCPIALAYRRQFPESGPIAVHFDSINKIDKAGHAKQLFGLPAEAALFMEEFDDADGPDELPSPISFEVELPV